MNERLKDKAVYKTAPATPGLLIIHFPNQDSKINLCPNFVNLSKISAQRRKLEKEEIVTAQEMQRINAPPYCQ